MLAYVFWHQRANSVSREEYQEKLSAFHQILQERQAPGFLFSMVLEMPQVPWMLAESEVYEDWYLVENSAALDPLDEAAVTGICREPHHRVARLANNGTGGLYRLKAGAIDPTQASRIRYATWFNKPGGMSYDALYPLLSSTTSEPRNVFWQRQMTMGPALEFCVHTPQKHLLAAQIKPLQVEARPVFVPGY